MTLETELNHSRRQADAQIESLEKLAMQLDSSIKIPGTEIRVGLDSIIGLIPGVGDVGTGFVSTWIVLNAWRLGASKVAIVHMLWNMSLDVVIGSVPLAGDLFDVAWKANLRNVRILRRNLYKQGRASRSSRILERNITPPRD